MTANYSEIKNWVYTAKDKGCTHLIIGCDTFDYDNYPIYVMPEDDIIKKIKATDKVDEVYNMSQPLEKQLKEPRSYHV